MHSQISHVLLYSVFFQIPIPSMNLQRVVHHIRTQLSCNLLSHSRIDSFVGIVGVDQTGRFPDNQPKSYWLYLEVMRSDAISAYLNCRYWKSDSFLPNCLRLFIYFFEAYRQKAAPPKLQLAMFILPPSNAFMAILKPSPSLPIRLQAGILTLSKLTKAVGCIVHPIFYSFLPQLIPLASAGTINAEISLADVLAMMMQIPLNPPPEINILDPFSTYSSPSFLAQLFIALESEPESGQVKQQLPKTYIEIIVGKYLSICSLLPNQSIIQQHMLWMVRYAAVGTHAVERAQKMTEAQSRPSPVPFLQQTAEQPISAASLNTSTGKCTFFYHSIAQGLIFFLAKSRA